jgi:cupin fold WbuC family metalloprotein
MTLSLITNDALLDMEKAARSRSRRRLHFNLHADYSDPCQRLLNVICSDSYIPPHCHDPSQGPEALFAIRGRFAVAKFDDCGNIISTHKMGSERYIDESTNLAGMQIEPGVWHTVIVVSDVGVLLEVKAGPFNPLFPKHVASWAPSEGTIEGQVYLRELRGKLRREFL